MIYHQITVVADAATAFSEETIAVQQLLLSYFFFLAVAEMIAVVMASSVETADAASVVATALALSLSYFFFAAVVEMM